MPKQKIVFGITGSIAAYKSPLILRLFKKENYDVQVVMTQTAKQFVSPLVLETLSQNKVLCQLSENDQWNNHVQLMDQCSALLIAPASANTIGKMANGICDDLLLALYLEAKCPIFLAPAMEQKMYFHPAVQENIKKLEKNGVTIIAPEEGFLASGASGVGRMKSPENIAETVSLELKKETALKGKNFLISLGPTIEAIDPIRYIGNRSSGIMGQHLANEIFLRGGNVQVVSGQITEYFMYSGIDTHKVATTQEMLSACSAYQKGKDVIVMVAAVADFKPVLFSDQKLKKQEKFSLSLRKNVDILQHLVSNKPEKQKIIGFALETSPLKQAQLYAMDKMSKKKLDALILNRYTKQNPCIGSNSNEVYLCKGNEMEKVGKADKKEIAKKIIAFIEQKVLKP